MEMNAYMNFISHVEYVTYLSFELPRTIIPEGNVHS